MLFVLSSDIERIVRSENMKLLITRSVDYVFASSVFWRKVALQLFLIYGISSVVSAPKEKSSVVTLLMRNGIHFYN